MIAGKPRSTHSASAAACSTLLIALCLCPVAPTARASDSTACYVGTYQLSAGGFVDIAPTDGNTLRWRRFDGTTGALTEKEDGLWTSTYGWTERPDGKTVRFSPCAAGRIYFDGEEGRRIRFNVRDTTFVSHGVPLVGRLILPQGTAVVPVVILLHGAEHDSARQFNPLQRLLPAAGVGAFVFDKRGTGGSSGSYSQDFNVLADDAVAAMREAKRLSGKRSGRIGYQTGSQSGWVAPLAANRAHVDFVIVCFGLAVSVIDEDQQEVEIEMREKRPLAGRNRKRTGSRPGGREHLRKRVHRRVRRIRCREGEVPGRALVQGSAWELHAFLPPLFGIRAARNGSQIPMGHAVPLRSDAHVAIRYDAAALDFGSGGLRIPKRRDKPPYQVTHCARPAL